jgi:hypothetical protein
MTGQSVTVKFEYNILPYQRRVSKSVISDLGESLQQQYLPLIQQLTIRCASAKFPSPNHEYGHFDIETGA